MNILDILHTEHIAILDEPQINCEDVIRKLGERLIQTDSIDVKYVSDVLEREKKFPTGLEVGELNVAIPHAAPDFVKRPAIAVGIVKQGVPFQSMADPSKSVVVHIVLLLALMNPENQLQVLEQTMELVQDHDRLRQLVAARDAEEVVKVLKQPQILTRGKS